MSFYRTLKRKRSQQEGCTSEDEDGLVWSWDWQLDQQGFADLGKAEAALYSQPGRDVRAISHIHVGHMRLRKASAERNLQTQDSAIQIQLQDGNPQYGILQDIWELKVGATVLVLLDVEVFRHSSADKSFAHGVRVSSARVPGGATRRTIVSPGDIKAQVFFSVDPTDAHHLHVFRLPSSCCQAASDGSEPEECIEF